MIDSHLRSVQEELQRWHVKEADFLKTIEQLQQQQKQLEDDLRLRVSKMEDARTRLVQSSLQVAPRRAFVFVFFCYRSHSTLKTQTQKQAEEQRVANLEAQYLAQIAQLEASIHEREQEFEQQRDSLLDQFAEYTRVMESEARDRLFRELVEVTELIKSRSTMMRESMQALENAGGRRVAELMVDMDRFWQEEQAFFDQNSEVFSSLFVSHRRSVLFLTNLARPARSVKQSLCRRATKDFRDFGADCTSHGSSRADRRRAYA